MAMTSCTRYASLSCHIQCQQAHTCGALQWQHYDQPQTVSSSRVCGSSGWLLGLVPPPRGQQQLRSRASRNARLCVHVLLPGCQRVPPYWTACSVHSTSWVMPPPPPLSVWFNLVRLHSWVMPPSHLVMQQTSWSGRSCHAGCCCSAVVRAYWDDPSFCLKASALYSLNFARPLVDVRQGHLPQAFTNAPLQPSLQAEWAERRPEMTATTT